MRYCNIRPCGRVTSNASNNSNNCAGWKTAGRFAWRKWITTRSAWMCPRTWSAWKSSCETKTARRDSSGGSAAMNWRVLFRLPDHRTSVNVVVICRQDERRIRIHHVRDEPKRRRWAVARLQRQCIARPRARGSVSAQGQRTGNSNIDEDARVRAERIEVHRAGCVVGSSIGHVQMTDEIFLPDRDRIVVTT